MALEPRIYFSDDDMANSIKLEDFLDTNIREKYFGTKEFEVVLSEDLKRIIKKSESKIIFLIRERYLKAEWVALEYIPDFGKIVFTADLK